MKFQYRQSLMKKAAVKYINRVEQKMAEQANKPEQSYVLNPTDEIFKGDLLEKAMEIHEKSELETSEKTKKVVKNTTKKTKKGKTKKIVKSTTKKIKNKPMDKKVKKAIKR